MIARAVSEYNVERARQTLAQLPATAPPVAEPETAPTGRRLPPRPSWWTGDEDATRASMMVAQALDVRKGKPA